MARSNFIQKKSSTTDKDNISQSASPSSLTHVLGALRENSSDVESLVYYFSVEIRPISVAAKSHSFFRDNLRSRMILKWMKFYSWSPRLVGDIHKQRRKELRKRLKLGDRQFALPLGWFMIDKFWSLRNRGWISGEISRPPVKYHECTDHWLDQSWDGHIGALTQASSAKDGSQKRIASTLSSDRQKIFRPEPEKSPKIMTRAQRAVQRQLRNSQGRLYHPCSVADKDHESSNMAEFSGNMSKDPLPSIYDLCTPDESICDTASQNENSRSVMSTESPTITKTPSEAMDLGSADNHFDASELSTRLERITEEKATSRDSTSTSIGCDPFMQAFGSRDPINQLCNSQDLTCQESATRDPIIGGCSSKGPLIQSSIRQESSLIDGPPQTLEALMKSARSCKKAGNAIVAEIKDLKAMRDQLWADKDKLYEEIKNSQVDSEEADRRLKESIPPTPAIGFAGPASFSSKIQEIRQKQVNRVWLESRKAAKAVLFQEIEKFEKKYAVLQGDYRDKISELDKLRASIKEQKALSKKFNTEVECLLQDFEKESDWVDPDSQWISDTDVDSDDE